MDLKLYVVLAIVGLCRSQSDSSKWVWGNAGETRRNDRTRIVTGDRRYNGELVSKPLFLASNNYNGVRQYEVTSEPDYEPYRPVPTQFYGPESTGPHTFETNFARPTNTLVNYNRPNNRPYENTYLGGGNRPADKNYFHGLKPGIGTNGRPILTGPTPSWEDDGQRKYKDYDVCKCVHAFNCNTPGIKFGSCDTDKQYCCYKSRRDNAYGNPGKPLVNVYERPRPRPVLAGPGGPVDVSRRPYQNKRPPPRPVVDPDRDFEEAYRKGLASTIYRYETRPDDYRDADENRYSFGRPSHLRVDNFKSSHPSKYGLYDPSADIHSRSTNSSISAIEDSR